MLQIEPGLEMTTTEQEPRTGGALVFRIEGELHGGSTAGMGTDGASFVNDLDATVVAGPMAGTRLTGLERFTMRPDGVALVAGPRSVETADGSVSISLRGHVAPPAGTTWPWPDDVARPGFEFPDLDLRVSGSAVVGTTDPRFAHLDGALASVTGWVNFESGEVEMEAWAM